jgi:biofilm PGA synthesis N-glycosyltransferase PgaC
MIVILLIAPALILLYLLYPAWLAVFPRFRPSPEVAPQRGEGVSLVLLTRNGQQYIREKVGFLAAELGHFGEYEFIVIDDASTDGTRDLLGTMHETYNLRLVLKEEQRGIPHSMNLGAGMARYDHLIFCDQRQRIAGSALTGLVAPLRDPGTGAVSGFISCHGKSERISLLRKHENFIKRCESRTGCLMGVYGPLYAVRKADYAEIPEHIILDDLYLSIRILARKKIVLAECSRIVDDDFIDLYDFGRSNRYLLGLIQILFAKDLIGNMPLSLRVMLVWHKYLRLVIPPLVLLCLLSAGWMALSRPKAALALAGVAAVLAISWLARRMVVFGNLFTLARINFYYVLSIVYLAFQVMISWTALSMKPRKP